jgi:chlorobactene glucosyltransferase
MAMLIALVIVTAVVLLSIGRDLLTASRMPLLEPLHDAAIDGSGVTVIIPARNEAPRIGRCLEGLVAQGLPRLEVIVLDDGSTDGTAEIAESFADRLRGLRVLAGAPLPDGWAGKPWACWQGAGAAGGEWLLFLDADTAPQPGMIGALLRHATTHRADFVTLLALLELETFWERIIMPSFVALIQAVLPLDRVNDPRSELAMANGQCILVRREVYVATDGHRAVRDSVLEDVRLAQTIKRAGYKLQAAAGPDLLRVRMYTNLSEIAEGLRKNAVAGVEATGLASSIWGGFRQSVLAFGPLTLAAIAILLILMSHSFGWIALAWSLALFAIVSAYYGYAVRRLNHLHPLWALGFPLGTLSYFLLAGLALLQISTGRGVTWKGRSYKK